MPEQLLLTSGLFIGAPLAALVIINLLSRRLADKFCFGFSLAVPLLQMLAAAGCLAVLLTSGEDFIEFSLFWDHLAQYGAAYFRVDWLSLVILFTIGLVSFAAILVGRRTIKTTRASFCSLVMVAILGMNGIAMVTDLFSLFIYLAITGIATAALIAIRCDSRRLEGAFKYLLMNVVGSVFLLIGLALIFLEIGSLSFDILAEYLVNWRAAGQPLLMLGLVFLVAGIAIKAALAPFHSWLPDVYQGAPSAVALFLLAIVTKAGGIYLIMRLFYSVFTAMDSMRIIFSLLALVSIIYGAVASFGQNDIKRLLAYSSISQLGYIVLGAASGSFLGILGAALHFFNHAVFKTTLFVNTLAVEEQVGHSKLDGLGGLQARMPVTGISSVLASLSAAGIPPLAGFWSKLIIIIAVWQQGQPIFAGLALTASLLTAAYFLRLQRQVFFGKLPAKFNEVQEAKGSLYWLTLVFSLITVGLGLAFPLLLLHIQAWGLL